MSGVSSLHAFIAYLKRIIFGYATPNCVGVDISSTAIKMVELVPDTLKIAKFNLWPLAKNLVSEGVINDIEKISEIIRLQWSQLESNYKDVAIAIPYNAVIIKDFVAPILATKYALDKYVRDQLSIELDNEDIDFDYSLLKKNPETHNQNLLVVVAKKEKIEEYQAIIQITGMKVAAIDIEPFALRFLYSQLLRMHNLSQQILVLDLGGTRIRAFFYENYENIMFNEISVNYTNFVEEAILAADENANLRDIININAFAMNLFMQHNELAVDLVKQVSIDVSKIIQLITSNMLVETKVSVSPQITLYLSGGNSLLPGLAAILEQAYPAQVQHLTDFLHARNPHIPLLDLSRLTTAIALATWGQQYAPA